MFHLVSFQHLLKIGKHKKWSVQTYRHLFGKKTKEKEPSIKAYHKSLCGSVCSLPEVEVHCSLSYPRPAHGTERSCLTHRLHHSENGLWLFKSVHSQWTFYEKNIRLDCILLDCILFRCFTSPPLLLEGCILSPIRTESCKQLRYRGYGSVVTLPCEHHMSLPERNSMQHFNVHEQLIPI